MSAERPTRRPNPFVGPRPFLPGEPLFGRDREVRALRNLLVAERIVVLYSPSGAGKTSLVQAGLIPKMQESGFHVLPVIRINQPPRERTDGNPNRYLASARRSLEPSFTGAEQGPVDLNTLRLSEFLASRPSPDDDPVADLLIFDQFEEILTLDPTDGPAKTEFFTQVGEALRVEGRWAVFSLREDHLAGLERFRPLIPTRLATSFRLEFLSREAAVVAIQGTASKGGIDFSKDAANLLVEDLSRVRVQQFDRSIAEHSGHDIEPVQLQVVCHRLWNHLPDDTSEIDLEVIAAFGRVDDALGAFYEESVVAVAQDTGTPERVIRDWFDKHLITEQGIRGQIPWELGELEGLNDRAVGALINAHLVRPESRRGAIWLELAHDRLIEPVRRRNATWFAAHLGSFRRQARLWGDEPPGSRHLSLLNQEGLEAADAWLADHPGLSLTMTERDFLSASRERQLQSDLLKTQREADAERQTSRKLGRLTAALFVVFLVAIGAAVMAKQRGDDQAKLSQVNLAGLISGVEVPNALEGQNNVLAAILARQAYLFEDKSGHSASQVASALNNALAPELTRTVRNHHLPANAVAISPDGRLLASAADDGEIGLWDIERQRLLPAPWTPPEGSRLTSLAFSPDAQLLAAGGCIAAINDTEPCADSGLRLWQWDMPTRSAEPIVLSGGQSGEVRAIAFDPVPGRRRLIAARGDGQVEFWDLGDLTHLARGVPLPGPRFAGALSVTFSQDGQLLAVGTCTERGTGNECLGGRVVVYDATNQEGAPRYLTTLYGPRDGDGMLAVAFSPDGAQIAGGSGDKMIWVWNGPFTKVGFDRKAWRWPKPLRGIPEVRLSGHSDAVKALAWPSQQTLISASWDGTVRLWNPQAPDLTPLELPGYRSGPGVLAAVVSLDGTRLATADSDGIVRIGDLRRSAEAPSVLERHDHEIWSVEFNPASKVLAAGASDGEVFLWWLDQEGLVPTVLPPKPEPTGCGDEAVFSLAMNATGDHLAAGYSDGTIQVWPLNGPGLVGREAVYDHGSAACVDVRGLAFHPSDPTVLASAGWDDGTVRLWDLDESSVESKVLRDVVDAGAPKAFRSLAFNHDGSLLAAVGCTAPPIIPAICQGGGLLRIWDAGSQSEPPLVSWDSNDPNDAFYAIAFGSNETYGELLAAGMLDGRIAVWRDTDGSGTMSKDDALSDRFFGNFYSVRALEFSVGGEFLFSGGDDATIRRWSVDDLVEPPLVLTSREGLVRAIAVGHGSDGNETWVASGASQGAVRLWSVDADGMAAAVCDQPGQKYLGEEEWKNLVGQNIRYEQTCPE